MYFTIAIYGIGIGVWSETTRTDIVKNLLHHYWSQVLQILIKYEIFHENCNVSFSLQRISNEVMYTNRTRNEMKPRVPPANLWMCVYESALVVQLCPTLWHHDCSPPGSSVYGISQARIQEWIAIPFSRGSSWLRDLLDSENKLTDPNRARNEMKPRVPPANLRMN